MVEQVEATQDDIDAAQRICGLPADPAHIQADKVVQAFRDHRIAAEARGMEARKNVAELLARMAKNRYDRADDSLAREVECIAEQVDDVICAALNGGQHE